MLFLMFNCRAILYDQAHKLRRFSYFRVCQIIFTQKKGPDTFFSKMYPAPFFSFFFQPPFFATSIHHQAKKFNETFGIYGFCNYA